MSANEPGSSGTGREPPDTLRPAERADHPWMEALLAEHWGSARVVSLGRLYDALACPAFIAEEAGARTGVVTYRIEGDACEILTMNSLRPRRGTGRRLAEAVLDAAAGQDCRRVWLVTTNDNRNAQRFWERVGFSLKTVHRGSMTAARRLKPEIPEHGEGGVPITDELEYELLFDDRAVRR